MNSTQINYCLKHIYNTNESMLDKWLDLSKIACIYLDQDANLYPDKKHVRFFFDSSTNILIIKTGKSVQSGFVADSDQPNHLISFNVIAGFIQTSKVTDVGQFEYVYK